MTARPQPDQTAVNTRALMAAAARLESAGYDGDAYRFCESLVVSVLADGYKRVEPPPALRGPTSTTAGRAAARALYQQIRNGNEENQA